MLVHFRQLDPETTGCCECAATECEFSYLSKHTYFLNVVHLSVGVALPAAAVDVRQLDYSRR